jgi:hypothetical protein
VPRFAAGAGIAAILAIVSLDALLRGPWLDEFWTLELSDTHNGLMSLLRDGWLHDTHPPVFNAWATLLGVLGVKQIAIGRLVSNLLAAALMLLAMRQLSRRAPGQAGFNVVVLLLTLPLPEVMEAFATYRSYFWQAAALATLVLVARHVAGTRTDLDVRKDTDLMAIGGLAAMAAIGLHYIGGLFGGLLAGAIALSALRRGLWRWAGLMLGAAALASLFVIACALLQAPNWATDFDHSWIDTPVLEALAIPVALGVGAVWHNPLPLLGLWIGRNRLSVPERRFVAMIGGVLVAGIAIILAVHAVKPIVVERYLIAVPVLVCAVLAVPAARLAREGLPFGLLVLVSIAVAAAPMVSASEGSWRTARPPRCSPPAAGCWDRPPRRAPPVARTRCSPGPTGCSPSATATPSTSST